MVNRRFLNLLACLAVLCCCTNKQLFAQQSLVTASVATQLPPSSQLYFTPNVGQWPEENPSIAQAVVPGGAVFITNSGIRILTEDQQNIQRKHQIHHFKGKDTQFTLSYHVTDLAFLNAQTPSAVQYHDFAPWKENFFLGHHSERWKSVSPARKITLKNLYPGIDIDIYFREQTLEFDWIIHPGANPNQIGLQVDNQTSLSLLKNTLNFKTSVATFQVNPPRASQKIALKTKLNSIDCTYFLI